LFFLLLGHATGPGRPQDLSCPIARPFSAAAAKKHVKRELIDLVQFVAARNLGKENKKKLSFFVYYSVFSVYQLIFGWFLFQIQCLNEKQ
jgi:hypothetical protein